MVEVCIMCHNEGSGEQVADTLVIRTIRRVKERLKMATNNSLVVCPGCLETHARRLKSYERKMLLHAALAVILIIMVIFVPLLASSFNPGSILVGLLMGGLIIALPLMDYVPPLASGRDVLAEMKEAKEAEARAAAQASAASGIFPSPKPGLSIPFFGKQPAESLSAQAAAPPPSAAFSPSASQPPVSSPPAAGVPPIWSSMKGTRPSLSHKKSAPAKKSKPAHRKPAPVHHKSKPAHKRRR